MPIMLVAAGIARPKENRTKSTRPVTLTTLAMPNEAKLEMNKVISTEKKVTIELFLKFLPISPLLNSSR
jgi:hypothetical protein